MVRNSLPKLHKKAQKVFNAWIRHRDEGKPCISCGKQANQAGHYFSVKQFSALRYHPDNVHLQCPYCNCYAHGNQAMYRIGLVNRIGEKQVKKLEALALSTRVKKWTAGELLQIIDQYDGC